MYLKIIPLHIIEYYRTPLYRAIQYVRLYSRTKPLCSAKYNKTMLEHYVHHYAQQYSNVFEYYITLYRAIK